MATTTPNFGWPVPTSTDLVKDGATAIEALGDAIDASLVDLEGGTTGQILAKNSNTDMDFVWTTPNPGDITAVTAGTGITGGGTSGAVTVSFDQANFGGGQFAAGKNKLINGDFTINQRAFSSTTTSASYGFDRWFFIGVDGTVTYSAQTFTAGAAPVAGYEGTNFARIVSSGQTLATAQARLRQQIEDVRTFAGQTVTMSFWAKASSGTPYVTAAYGQGFGTGGSSGVFGYATKQTITTSWARYSFTMSIPSISGKTIGPSSSLGVSVWTSAGSDLNSFTDSLGIQNTTIDIWGVQLEAGSTATPFQTASGTLQGELALCRRYLPAITTPSGFGQAIFGYAYATNGGIYSIPFDVQARVAPTGITIPTVSASTFIVYNKTNNDASASAIAFDVAGVNGATVLSTATLTQGDATRLLIKGSAGYILFTGCEL